MQEVYLIIFFRFLLPVSWKVYMYFDMKSEIFLYILNYKYYFNFVYKIEMT